MRKTSVLAVAGIVLATAGCAQTMGPGYSGYGYNPGYYNTGSSWGGYYGRPTYYSSPRYYGAYVPTHTHRHHHHKRWRDRDRDGVPDRWERRRW